jgi:acyl-CoA thioesterase I
MALTYRLSAIALEICRKLGADERTRRRTSRRCCVETFGPETRNVRNFPPDKDWWSWQVMFNAFKCIAASHSKAGKEDRMVRENGEGFLPAEAWLMARGRLSLRDAIPGEATMRPRTSRLKLRGCLLIVAAISYFTVGSASAATVVALGASNTYGKGVARNQAFPVQLETILRAKGLDVRVVNAGINGDTTEGMLQRLDRAVPNGTRAVILQPGGNDGRKGSQNRTAEIQSRLSARGIAVIMLPNNAFKGLPHQPDGQHLTPEGYHMVAEYLASQVAGTMGR